MKKILLISMVACLSLFAAPSGKSNDCSDSKSKKELSKCLDSKNSQFEDQKKEYLDILDEEIFRLNKGKKDTTKIMSARSCLVAAESNSEIKDCNITMKVKRR